MAANAFPPTSTNLSANDQAELQEMYEKLRACGARLLGSDGKSQTLPPSLHSFLGALLANMNNGYSVTMLQGDASITTVQAGKLLGVSRSHLIGLLENGEIPFHKVGTHRRVLVRDILAYKAKRDVARRKILDDLARSEYEEGIYDRLPDL